MATPIPNQCPGVGEPIRVSEEQVAGCLGGPRAGRVGRDPGEVDASGGVFDDEQNMQPFE